MFSFILTDFKNNGEVFQKNIFKKIDIAEYIYMFFFNYVP